MIESAICNSYKTEVLQGIHDVTDTYKIALYGATATLNKTTTQYTAAGEVADSEGYVAGGIALTGLTVSQDGDTAIIDFNDPQWPAASITAWGAMIYNSTKSNKAVCVLSFGEDVISTNDTFSVILPAPAAATAVIRLS